MRKASLKSAIQVACFVLWGCLIWGFQPQPVHAQDLDWRWRCIELMEESTASLKAQQWTRLVEVLRKRLSECKSLMSTEEEAGALYSISIGLIELGQFEDALAISRRCTQIKPDAAFCHFESGRALAFLGRFDEAETAFRQAIQIGGYDELNAAAVDSSRRWLDHIQKVREAAREGQAEGDIPVQGPAVIYGTGFLVTTEGHFVTNEHVVRDCREVTIGRQWKAELLDSDPRSDLAVLKVEPKQSARLALRRADAVRVGEEVYTFGFPLPGLLSSKGNLSFGIVSATSGLQDSDLLPEN